MAMKPLCITTLYSYNRHFLIADSMSGVQIISYEVCLKHMHVSIPMLCECGVVRVCVHMWCMSCDFYVRIYIFLVRVCCTPALVVCER